MGWWDAIAGDERGAEQVEYVLLLAVIGVPLIVAGRLMWAVLLGYFQFEALIVDLPVF